MTRCAFLAALLFSAIAVSAVAEDAFGDLIDEGQPHGEIAELKSPSDAVTGAEGTLAKSQSGADRENFGESTTDQQSLSAPKQVTSAQSVTSGPGKYLCFKAGSGTVGSETHTVGLQFTRCDAHATCDPNKPACACKTGYAGDGETCEMVDCKDPQKLMHGRVKAAKTTYKASAFFECDKGYIRTGPAMHTCRADGKWSKGQVACMPQSCGRLTAPPNTEMSCSGHTYQKTCHIKCKSGFALVPPTTDAALKFVKGPTVLRTCGADGNWAGFKPECKPVHCARKGSPVLGDEVCPNGNAWQSKCTFTCKEGHHLANGSPTDTTSARTCEATGLWSGNSELTCVGDKCPQLNAVPNGQLSCTGSSFGAKCALTCSVGYAIRSGDEQTWPGESVTCGAGGKWDKVLASCSIQDCGALEAPEMGAVSHSGGTTYLQKAQYTCQVGHYMTGTANRACGSDGQWTGSTPTCTAVNCGELPVPDNSHAECTGNTYGSECSYLCHEGHDFVGTKVRKCMADGQWSGEAPTCRVTDCGGLDTPLHAYKGCQATIFGKECVFACKEGHYLVGGERRKCDAGGKWSGSQPSCALHTCGEIPAVVNGKKVCDGSTFRKKCDFHCDQGYVLSGRKDTQCDYDYGEEEPQEGVSAPTRSSPKPYPVTGLEIDLSWYGRKPVWVGTPTVCAIQDCKAHAPLLHGINECTGTTYGNKCTHSCDAGYVLTGSAERVCNQHGEWSGNDPACTPIDCGELPSSEHVTAKCDGRTFQKQCIFACDDEKTHVFTGFRMRVCEKSGVWSGVAASCTPNQCGEPEMPQWQGKQTGSMQCKSGPPYVAGTDCTFTCDKGYTLSGSAQQSCLKTGEWSSTPVACMPKTCSLLPIPKNGAMQCTGTTFENGMCKFSCEPGYKNEGSTQRKCDEEGHWTGKEAKCEKEPCEVFAAPDNADGYCTGPNFGDVCTYTCKRGYTSKGSFAQTCQDDKKWNGEKLECHMKDCGKLAHHDKNLIATCTGTLFGSKCTFSCPNGYEMVSGTNNMDGTPHDLKAPYLRHCAEDGAWTGSEAHCRVKDCGIMQVPNAEVKCDGTAFGKKCRATCARGYTSAGSVEHTCTETGKWSGEPTVCSVASCGDLSTPPHGSMSCEGFKYGQACTFNCDKGFDMFGDAFRSCEEDGRWSGAEATCKISSCPALNSPSYGVAKCNGAEHDKTCALTCNPGHALFGSSLRRCQSNKQWSGSDTTCAPKDCGELPAPNDGTIQCSGTKLGDSCQLTCQPGYTLAGSATRKCSEAGDWDGSSAICAKKDCGPLAQIENGVVNHGEGTTVGAGAAYSCNRGYKLVGDDFRKCKTNGLWSGKSPSCRLLQCPIMVAPTDGTAACAGTRYSDTCKFSCNAGHVMEGPATRTCGSDNKWDGTAVICKVVECGGLSTPEFGSKTCEATSFGKGCTFTCQPGYDLTGSNTRSCTNSGVWSGEQTVCTAKKCGELEPVADGISVCTETTYQSVCTSQCKPGYTFSGSHTRTCTETGVWDGVIAECKIVDCGKLAAPENGVIDLMDGTVYQSKAVISCNTGYTRIGSATRHCLATGIWDGAEAKCQQNSCGPLPDIAQGTMKCSGTSYGDSCLYTCADGHELSGDAHRKCSPQGEWSGTAPSCRVHDCGMLRDPKFGTKTCDGTTFGSKCSFQCNTGYYKSAGSDHRTCASSKQWSGASFTCKARECGALEKPPHGTKDCVKTTFGGKCSFGCGKGYLFSGTSTRECLATGVWSGTTAMCSPVDCGHLPLPHYATTKAGCSTTTVGSLCDRTCLPGYTAAGSTSRRCLDNGQWSGNQLRCVIQDCGEPVKPASGFMAVDKTTFQGIAKFHCAKGYRLQGSTERGCRDDGKWSGVETQCKPIACIIRSRPANGNVACDGNKLNSKCTFSCDVGYLLKGEKDQVCRDSGSWDAPPPSCSIATCSPLENPQNGVVECNGNSFNKQCVTHCHEGHRLSGSEIRTCASNGAWSHTEATCRVVDCGPLSVPDNGSMECATGTEFTHTCNFKCKDGHMMTGSEARYCRSDGKWSGSPTACKPRSCGPLQQPVGGTQDCTGSAYKDVCKFECKDGLQLDGESSRTCGTDGNWTGSSARCVGLKYGSLVSFKTHWDDYLTVARPQCQTQAAATCKCENFNIKHPEWGMDSACCAQPAPQARAKPWCFCETGGFQYCEESLKPSVNVDHADSTPTKSAKFIIEQYDSLQSSAFLQYGDDVVIKTHEDHYVMSSSAGHVELSQLKFDKTKFTLVEPGNHNYRGFVNHDMKIGLKSIQSKYLSAQTRKMTNIPAQIPQYKNKCKVQGEGHWVQEFAHKYDSCCKRICHWTTTEEAQPVTSQVGDSLLQLSSGLEEEHRRNKLDDAVNVVVDDMLGDATNLLQLSDNEHPDEEEAHGRRGSSMSYTASAHGEKNGRRRYNVRRRRRYSRRRRAPGSGHHHGHQHALRHVQQHHDRHDHYTVHKQKSREVHDLDHSGNESSRRRRWERRRRANRRRRQAKNRQRRHHRHAGNGAVKHRHRVCQCVADSKCKKPTRLVYKYDKCKEWWPKPGKFIGFTTGTTKGIDCHAAGKRCVVANKPWLASWEIFTITKA